MEVLDRSQKLLHVLQFNLDRNLEWSAPVVAIEERFPDYFVNITDLFFPLKQTPAIIWGSEETGYRHLYLLTSDRKKETLTKGDWQLILRSHIWVDEVHGLVFFVANRGIVFGCGWRRKSLGMGSYKLKLSIGSQKRHWRSIFTVFPIAPQKLDDK